MTWSGRAVAVLSVGLGALGCAATLPPDKLPQSKDTPFVLPAQDVESAVGVRTSRSQAPEPQPPQVVMPKVAAPPVPGQPPGVTGQLPGPPPDAGVQQASMVVPVKMRISVAVSAWVNGKPIFEDEVRLSLQRDRMQAAMQAPPAQRVEKVTAVVRETIDGLIDQELLVQDMMVKIEKQPKIVEKYKTAATKECQKRIAAQLRAMGLNTVEELEQKLAEGGGSLESVKRLWEREFLAGVYARGRLEGPLSRIGHDEIRDYYNTHQNMFLTPDKVKWQNLFIAVGPKHPTLADARRFAEQVMAHWRNGTDIAQLLEFDDGDSQSRKGDGAGELRGDIRPRELEPLLFNLHDGEFGPLYEMPTGIHLYRLVHREIAGVMPLDEKLQTSIGNKLKNEIFDVERKELLRDLRAKAGDRVVVVEKLN
jgi:peptidyl-prolyl cis-trans isomerase SurA